MLKYLPDVVIHYVVQTKLSDTPCITHRPLDIIIHPAVWTRHYITSKDVLYACITDQGIAFIHSQLLNVDPTVCNCDFNEVNVFNMQNSVSVFIFQCGYFRSCKIRLNLRIWKSAKCEICTRELVLKQYIKYLIIT